MDEDALRTELSRRESAIAGGASWFFWIAGFSVLNSLVFFLGESWNFMMGLGLLQLAEGLLQEASPLLRALGLAFNLAAAGLFVLLGLQARKRARWAFLTGFTLYFLDSLVSLLLGEYASLGFHGLALFMILGGYRSINKASAIAARIDQLDTRAKAAAKG
jgi:hypothetical protein